jgi:GPH family glycoside/pentoside/hexuronide:cation symporter
MSERLSIKEKISYGVGDVGSNMSWNMVASFLLYFYTNVALLPVALVGTLLLVSRVMDALIDPAIGMVVDRTRSRLGKARPYLLYAPFPLGILLVMVFYSPPASVGTKMIYAYATLILIGIVYSFVNIPYAALMALMTRNPNEKMQLSSMRTVGSSIGTTIVTAATIPFVNWLGPARQGFSIAAAVFAAVSVFLFLVVVLNTRERFVDHNTREKIRIGHTLGLLLQNRTWLVTFVFSFLNLMRLGVLIGGTAYFAINVMNRPWLISVLLPAISMSSIIAAVASPRYFGRFGIRKGNWLALFAALVCFAALPISQSYIPIFLFIYAMANIAMGVCTPATWAMSTYAIDYQQWQHGSRNDGLLVSSISLSTKVGIAGGLALAAYALAAAHFDPLHVNQASRSAIKLLFYGGSISFTLLMFTCISFYDLDALHPEIVRELNLRSFATVDPVELGQQGY